MKLKEPVIIIARCPSDGVPACEPGVSSYCLPHPRLPITPKPSRDAPALAGDGWEGTDAAAPLLINKHCGK